MPCGVKVTTGLGETKWDLREWRAMLCSKVSTVKIVKNVKKLSKFMHRLEAMATRTVAEATLETESQGWRMTQSLTHSILMLLADIMWLWWKAQPEATRGRVQLQCTAAKRQKQEDQHQFEAIRVLIACFRPGKGTKGELISIKSKAERDRSCSS